MDELISVIVPIYHVEEYLEKCIDSILAQTYQNIEIILIDDGSDDSCPQICDEYQKKDSRIRVVHKKNGGLSDARNAGIDIACGKYYAFVDGDDIISPNYISFLYRAIVENDADISQCQFVEYGDILPTFDFEYINPVMFSKLDMLRNLEQSNIRTTTTVAWSKLYKAVLFEGIRFPFGKLHEDEFTTYRILMRCETIAFLNIPLYGYFNNAKGIIHSKISSKRLDAIEALIERYQFYANNDCSVILPLLANHLFESFLVYLDPNQLVVDFTDFKKRREELFYEFKKTVSEKVLCRRYRTIFLLSKSPEQMYFWYKMYLKIGFISKVIGWGKAKEIHRQTRSKLNYRKECKQLFCGYKPDNTVFILGSIEYDNLGDHAIVYAQKIFLQNEFPNCSVIEIRDELYNNMRQWLIDHIDEQSIITIPGGGNMGNIWIDDENRRRRIIQDFPNNKIIVFPQTIDYSDDINGKIEIEKSKEIYNKHSKLTLCAREEKSYEQMSLLYDECNVLYIPDIVLSLPAIINDKHREGALVCFRTDKERKLLRNQQSGIYDFLTKKYNSVSKISTISDTCIPYQKRICYLEKIWDDISKAEVLVTDRLHGMIFAYITGTPCIVFPNKNHKIIGTYDAWLRSCNYIILSSVDSLSEDILQLPKIEDRCIVPSLYEKYTILKGVFEE